MFVRDENGREIFRHTTDGGEPLADLARAEPGVHEDAGFIGFDIGAIATGTAAEDGEFDGHEWTLTMRKWTGKFFRLRMVRFIGFLRSIKPLNMECSLLIRTIVPVNSRLHV